LPQFGYTKKSLCCFNNIGLINSVLRQVCQLGQAPF